MQSVFVSIKSGNPYNKLRGEVLYYIHLQLKEPAEGYEVTPLGHLGFKSRCLGPRLISNLDVDVTLTDGLLFLQSPVH